MTEYILTRTWMPPAKINGELVEHFESTNAAITGRPKEARQWFIADVYKTTSGTWVAHVMYRAGARIRREQPVDVVFTAKSSDDLVARLDEVEPVPQFVTGWPDGGHPRSPEEKDFSSNHEAVCDYATEQWNDIFERIAARFEKPEEIE